MQTSNSQTLALRLKTAMVMIDPMSGLDHHSEKDRRAEIVQLRMGGGVAVQAAKEEEPSTPVPCISHKREIKDMHRPF